MVKLQTIKHLICPKCDNYNSLEVIKGKYNCKYCLVEWDMETVKDANDDKPESIFKDVETYNKLVLELVISRNSAEYAVEYMSKSKDKRIREIASYIDKALKGEI